MKRFVTISLVAACICLFLGNAYHQLETAVDSSPYVVTGNDLRSVDNYVHYLPRLTFIKQSIREGSFPLWNPYEAVGHPFLAEIGTRLFYPSTWIVLLLDAPQSMFVMQILNVLVGLIGMIIYLRYLNLTWPAVGLGTLIFGYSLLSESLSPLPLASTFCWLPIVLLAAHRLFDKPGFTPTAALALSLGFSFLGGFPQYFYYICLFVSGYFSILVLFSLHRCDLKIIALKLLLFACAFVLMIGLVSVQLFPTLELAQQSIHRIGEQLTPEQINIFSNFLFSGGHVLRDYSVVVFLVPLAFANRKNRPVAIALSALLAYAVLFVLSKRVPQLAVFGEIPFADHFRIPNRIMVVQDFVVAVVTAIGLSQLQSDNVPKLWGAEKKKLVFSWIYISICLLVMPFPLLQNSVRMALHSPIFVLVYAPWLAALLILLLCLCTGTSRFKLVGTLCILLFSSLGIALYGNTLSRLGQQAIFLNAFLIAFTIIVVLSAFAPRLPAWTKKSSILAIVGLAVLTIVQYRDGSLRMPIPALTEVNGHNSLFDERIEWIKDNAGCDRVLLSREEPSLVPPDVDLGYMYGFHHINSYEPFAQTRWKHFARFVMGAKEFDEAFGRSMFYGIISDALRDSFLNEPRMVGLASLKYVVALGHIEHDKLPDGWDVIQRGNSGDSGFSVYENRLALPRAYLANNYRIVQNEEAALQAMRQEISLQPDSVVLENDSPSFPSVRSPSNPGSVRIKEYGINAVELEVEAEEPCLVILTDCFYPGWKAFVDGEGQAILRANSLFRAVEVTPGEHTVVFRYRPASVFWGAAISLISLFVICFGLLLVRRNKKRDNNPATGGNEELSNDSSQSDFLKEFLKQSPVFYAFIRAIECRSVRRAPFVPPVLDLGCGDGMFGSILFENRPGAISFGVDLSKEDIQRAKQTNVYQVLQIADLAKLPFADNSIGSILSNSVFEHLEHIDAAIHEAWRVLKPGGMMVLTAPNDRVADNFLVSRLLGAIGLAGTARAVGNFGNKALGNRICLSPQQWKEKLDAAGFQTVECSTIVPPGMFNLSELFIPLGLFSILSKRISGRLLLTRRRLTLKPLHAFLKKYYEYDGDSPGLACVVVAVK